MLNRDGFLGTKRDDKFQRNPAPSAGTPSATGVQPAAAGAPEARGASAQAKPAVEEVKGNRLIVGPDIKLKGEISDCDTIVVEGRVEATTDSHLLQIAEKGAFKGTVGIDVAEIRGHFEGELTAREKLVVYATGVVSGKIRYGKIVIEEGGEVSGDVRSLAAAPADEKAGSDLWLAHDQKNKSQPPASATKSA
ncbi:MAG: bactofilin family protein [Pseudomonadota bacterium]